MEAEGLTSASDCVTDTFRRFTRSIRRSEIARKRKGRAEYNWEAQLELRTIIMAVPPKPANQHLAVLLPKQLWKVSLCPFFFNARSHSLQPDSSSSACDNFYCRVPFSLFERKHVCFLYPSLTICLTPV